ncbi:hypothetical protein NDA17_007193 [Ustilago hordei]|nr:hypothetical protein NDA17_007193 [Ustilago hordei]
MAPTAKSTRSSSSASASSSSVNPVVPTAKKSKVSGTSGSPSKTASGSASSMKSKSTNGSIQQNTGASASPSKPANSDPNNLFDNPFVLSDTDDDAELSDSSITELVPTKTLRPLQSVPQQTSSSISHLSPSSAHQHDDTRSNTTQDRSYATSLNSDLHASSDSTLTSVSSLDSDSDDDDRGHAVIAKTAKHAHTSLRRTRPASVSTRASDEVHEAPSLSSSSTPTPSRRSVRISSSGSSVQKALQRRDELDVKLTASPIRRKADSPEVSVTKRGPGRPRKSAPEASPSRLANARLVTPQSSASLGLQATSSPASARRSSRLSVPSAQIASTPITPSRRDVASPSKELGDTLTLSQEPGREPRRSRRSRGLGLAEETEDASNSSSPVLASTRVEAPASTSAIPHATSTAVAADSMLRDVSRTPLKRGPGRPRTSQNIGSPSPLASTTPRTQQQEETRTTRSQKRSLSPVSVEGQVTMAASKDEELQRSPRRKRSKFGETSSSVSPSKRVQASNGEILSRKEAIDLLDDDMSELSDDSDMSIDSPGPSQLISQPARRGRPPSAANAEARKLKRASRQDKDGKKYHVTGLYAGEADAKATTSLAHVGEAPNAIFPLPIHFGAQLLTEERDFALPYPIYASMEKLRDRVNAKRKPPRYQQISRNKYYSRPKLQGEVPLCSCQPGSGCGSDCINRMLMFICDPKTCPSGSNCTNISLGRRPTVKTAVHYYGRRGFGLKTLEPIKKDDFIDEYRGEVIDLHEASKRVTDEYKATGNFYLLDYDTAAGELLDGGRKGNITRFANHSCEPNCRIEKFIICGTDEALSAEFQIGLFALRDIEAGEELTYNYGWSAFQPRDITGAPTEEVPPEQCLCGAANCAGILGGKKPPATKAGKDEVAANSRKKTANGKGKARSKGKARKAVPPPRARMRSMTPMLSAARLSAAAMPSSVLSAALNRASRKQDEAQSNLLNKIVIRRREQAARVANKASTSKSVQGANTPASSSSQARSERDLPVPSAPSTSMQPPNASTQGSSTAETKRAALATIQTDASNVSASSKLPAINQQSATSPAASKKVAKVASGNNGLRLPLLAGEAASNAAKKARAAKARTGTKGRRWDLITAGKLAPPSEGSSSSAASSDGTASDFQKQDNAAVRRPASKKIAGGKTARRGRHKLQLSSEEAERRAAERRSRNAFLARVRRASKRGIVIEDPSQHPLKKISIQCTAAPENTYIPDLPSTLVELGMTTADARRARNAFLARVRRAMKRGAPKEVAIKMAAKPLPGDPACDTPVMKAQRTYMEQLEREAVDQMSSLAADGASEGSLAGENSQQAQAGDESWVDESN